ncbi:DeoR/GlpR family DNA-binding transcription regulator [Streptococcus thoraltensis]|uniref:DeoR/GlpR family DNA-binding transcription regulator n=1 Tax=Streptococcus thoraltensis TaxID=55085 RepID=UPI000373C76B|nr:DeoR/GlpR family DNA-binding transcription regulator [Streptococcus thoraltensis]MDY4760511.1 DeoR/GlpR family DNA-binding transcription regulator [Streptococcus thoraltensis]
MKKKERHEKILDILKVDGVIKVKDIIAEMNISDMTARRDLDTLANDGLLIRTHGGAQFLNHSNETEEGHEKTHTEKKVLQTNEKKQVARAASKIIKDGETVFIGPGTTLEHLAVELKNRNIRVITNSLPVFLILHPSSSVDLILIGGECREITGAFVGSIAVNNLKSLSFSKAFVSANAVFNNSIATYSDVEGDIQKIALDNSVEKILLVDSSKFDGYDFYNFYDLNRMDLIVTDKKISKEVLDKYKEFSKIVIADK